MQSADSSTAAGGTRDPINSTQPAVGAQWADMVVCAVPGRPVTCVTTAAAARPAALLCLSSPHAERSNMYHAHVVPGQLHTAAGAVVV